MQKFLFALIFLLPTFLNAQTLFPFKLQKEALLYKKRKVKTIKTYLEQEGDKHNLSKIETFNKKGQVISLEYTGERPLIFKYEYNKKGLLTRQTKSTKDGIQKGAVDYEYKDGLLIRETHTVKPKDYVITYHYDSNNHIDSSFISSTESQRDVWHYNEDGQVSAVLGFNTNDYDSHGNWVEEYKELFYYDEDSGLLTKSISCFGHLCYTNEHHFNKKGQEIETLEYEGDHLIGKTVYEYNKKGLLQNIIYTPDKDAIKTTPKKLTTLEYSHH